MIHPTPLAISVIQDAIRTRQEAIDSLCKAARAEEKFASPTFWAMVYDFEKAPKTTDRTRLARADIAVPSPDHIPVMTEDEVTRKLDELVSALGWFRIIVRFPNVSDRDALTMLVPTLDEEVSDTTGPYCVEYLDLSDQAEDSQLLPPSEPSRWEGRLPTEADLEAWAPLLVPPPTVPAIA